MLRRVLYLLAFVALVACADRKESAPTGQVAIRSLSPVGEQWQEVAQGEMPEELTLLVEVENRGARLKVLSGEVGVRYNGRKVAILSLLEEVSIAGRRSRLQAVTLPSWRRDRFFRLRPAAGARTESLSHRPTYYHTSPSNRKGDKRYFSIKNK